jgi:MerR family mercuric resistance operon transcriptional regulator
VRTFTIGRLAEAAGVHVETVRYYERRGLIERPPRPPDGYRRYTEDDLWRLQFIGRGKELGFTLAEIAEVLAGAGGSPDAVVAAAEAKIAAVDAEQRRLADVRCRLRRLADLCRHGADADCLALRLP